MIFSYVNFHARFLKISLGGRRLSQIRECSVQDLSEKVSLLFLPRKNNSRPFCQPNLIRRINLSALNDKFSSWIYPEILKAPVSATYYLNKKFEFDGKTCLRGSLPDLTIFLGTSDIEFLLSSAFCQGVENFPRGVHDSPLFVLVFKSKPQKIKN